MSEHGRGSVSFLTLHMHKSQISEKVIPCGFNVHSFLPWKGSVHICEGVDAVTMQLYAHVNTRECAQVNLKDVPVFIPPVCHGASLIT